MKRPVFFAIFLIISILFLLLLDKGTKSVELISPLLNQERVLGLNQWLPKAISVQTNDPKINAKAAFFISEAFNTSGVIDTKDGQTLYAKNEQERLPIASLVKVMTVLVALEHKKMDDTFSVSQKATEMEPDEMILLPGETLTLKELLYGIFLVSANDGAEVLAEGTLRQATRPLFESQGEQDSREKFIKLMNDKAKQLGMENSYFANPTGLDEDIANSYSTAYDLAILTRYLIRNYPEVVEISKTPYIFIPETDKHQSYEMWSGINLLTSYPGVIGFKTGYTPEVGLTLITLARKDGYEVIGVLLGSDNRRDEARELLDYSFKKLN